MRRVPLALLLALAFLATGCTEKKELRALCAAGKVGDRRFETEEIARGAAALKKAEEAEEIVRDLNRRRTATIERRTALVDDIAKQRAEAEAMSLDDKDARRKAILDVTAMEQDAQKLAEEISRYQADVERNQADALRSRAEGTAVLRPLLDRHGMKEACHATLAGR
jgi:hypothetical protein